MKKNDYILAGLIVAVALFLYGGLKIYQYTQRDATPVVYIAIDGQRYGTYPLNVNREIVLQMHEGNYNKIMIKDGEVSMEEANCPNQICVKHHSIHEIGSSITCLPHKVLVEIRSSNDPNAEESNQNGEGDVDGATN